MNQIRIKFGPFDKEEIQFYKHRLSDGAKCTINSFQRDMVFNLFLKYFGDSNTLNSINLDDYVTLIIAAKRILESTGMVMLPYIISAKVIRLASRKNVNKKELIKIESSPLWEEIKNKYKKITQSIKKEQAKGEKANDAVINSELDELSNFSGANPYDMSALYATALYNAYKRV